MQQKDFVKVSEIVTCLNCPRQLYFSLQNNESKESKKSTAYITHLFLRELNLRIPLLLNSNCNLLDELKKALDTVAEEITLIYRNNLIDVDDAQITQAKNAAGAHLQNILSGLKNSIDKYGKERLHQLITPWKQEQELRSQKYLLAGRLDKIIQLEKEIIPSIIKTGNPPEYGVWQPDRVQLTAYSILVEENYQAVIKRGFVEYARSGALREVAIKHHDRRRVLRIRDEVLEIKKGTIPRRIESGECNFCMYKTKCETRVSLASRFFENIL